MNQRNLNKVYRAALLAVVIVLAGWVYDRFIAPAFSHNSQDPIAVTVQPERHIKYFDIIPLGQPVDSFFSLYSVIMLEGGITEWTMEKYADKVYFHFRDEDGNSEEDYNQSYMGDLYNDTIYCFYEGEEWESPEILYGQGYLDYLKAICDTVFVDEPDYLHTREFRPGGYVDVIISQSGRIFAYTDSIAYARYEQLHE